MSQSHDHFQNSKYISMNVAAAVCKALGSLILIDCKQVGNINIKYKYSYSYSLVYSYLAFCKS